MSGSCTDASEAGLYCIVQVSPNALFANLDAMGILASESFDTFPIAISPMINKRKERMPLIRPTIPEKAIPKIGIAYSPEKIFVTHDMILSTRARGLSSFLCKF